MQENSKNKSSRKTANKICRAIISIALLLCTIIAPISAEKVQFVSANERNTKAEKVISKKSAIEQTEKKSKINQQEDPNINKEDLNRPKTLEYLEEDESSNVDIKKDTKDIKSKLQSKKSKNRPNGKKKDIKENEKKDIKENLTEEAGNSDIKNDTKDIKENPHLEADNKLVKNEADNNRAVKKESDKKTAENQKQDLEQNKNEKSENDNLNLNKKIAKNQTLSKNNAIKENKNLKVKAQKSDTLESKKTNSSAIKESDTSLAKSSLNEVVNTSSYKANLEQNLKQELNINSRSSILIDANSGKILYGDNIEERLPIASMTKTMTMLILLEKVENGQASLEDITTISEHSASQIGSQCFLDAGKDYKVGELLKAVCIASANDACVAIAEYISGDENVFVGLMNEKAKQMGLKNTHFSNSTGLIDENNYSTAKDICAILLALQKYDIVKDYSKIWMTDFMHSKGRITELVNTNRLIRTNKDLIMSKTGFTDKAGYCMVANAKRGDMNLLASTLGESKSENRFETINKLLNYGFTNYGSQKVVDIMTPYGVLEVKNGEEKQVQLYAEKDCFVLCKKGEEQNFTTSTLINSPAKAPITEGEVYGKIEIYDNAQNLVKSVNLIAKNNVDRRSYGDIVKDILSN